MAGYSVSGAFGEVKIFEPHVPSNRFTSTDHVTHSGWHRVTVFGDYREQLLQLYRMKSLDVTEEDR